MGITNKRISLCNCIEFYEIFMYLKQITSVLRFCLSYDFLSLILLPLKWTKFINMEKARLSQTLLRHYSLTCIKRPLKGRMKNGLLIEVVS